MASNPYGIAQVDIPSLLGMHAQMKQRRLEELYRSQQMERQQKEDERQDRAEDRNIKLQGLYAKALTAEEGAGPSKPATASPAPTPSPVPIATPQASGNTIAPEGAAAMRKSLGDAKFEAWKQKHGIVEVAEASSPFPTGGDGAPPLPLGLDLPPRTDGSRINQDVLREIISMGDFEGAEKIMKFVYDSDKRGLEQVTRRGEAMARAAKALSSVPLASRPAELQRWAPFLVEQGFAPEQLQSVDLSDASLNTFYRQGVSIAQMIQQDNADRNFEAAEANRQADNARADQNLGIRQDALRIAKQREGRLAAGKGLGGDDSDLSYLMGD